MAECIHTGKCCFRGTEENAKECQILEDTKFRDGKCHFRRLEYGAPNLYDLERNQKHVSAPSGAELAEARRMILNVSGEYQTLANRIRSDMRYNKGAQDVLEEELNKIKSASKACRTVMKCLDFVEVRR